MAHQPSFAEGPAADAAAERTRCPGPPAPPPLEAPREPAPPGLLDAVRDTYERGLYLQAYRAAAPLGPLPGWPGVEGQLLAGRLAYQLGAPALGARLHLRAHRRHPDHGEAWLWAHRAAVGRLGPYAVAARLRAGGPAAASEPEVLAVRGTLAARLRDFDEAERLLGRALELDPRDAWLHVERGVVHELADEYEAALAAADRALALAPWYRPAVDFRAHVLVLLGREDEAVALLQAGLDRLEAASTAEALLQLQVERGEHAAAEATLDRIEALTPLRARGYASWLEGRRSDVAYQLGDRARAVAHARRSGHPFYQALAARLEAAAAGARRVVLPVPFVRQHHMTCAPATLSAICAFHGVEAAHLGIAEVICYDGTPDHAERRWAAGRGFAVRELTVTFDAARALLDRGLPFTICAVDPGSSHLQAVVGYDEARRTLLLRDPYFRSLVEIAEGWLEDHRASGPRGMALAPPGRHALLDGLDLPEADRHDLYHRLQAALVDHDRPLAAACAEGLAALGPRHRLTLQGERSLASYDGNEERRLAATEALLALHPDDVNLRAARQGSLATLGRRQARIEWLRAEQARRPHPLLAQALADALHDDARHQPEAVALARAAARQRPGDGLGYHILADALWGQGAQEEAALAYRAAACLERTNEHYAEASFRACRCLGRTEEGLAFLRRRFERHGRRSSQPVVTLVEALDALDRDAEGLAALEQALRWRPDDGPLLLFAARTHALAGQGARAAALLQGARGAAHEADVLRTRARLDELNGELAAAAEAWAGVLALEPFNTRAAQAATRLLAETRDRRAAVDFLRRHVERFPHHQELGRLLVGWLDEEPPEVVEAELRRLVATDPADAWSWRELALHLSRHGRGAEALAALGRAEAVEPSCTSLENVRSSLLADAGRPEEARAALRASLRLEVDQDWAIGRLLALAGDGAARTAELRFLRAEIVRQVGFGDALLAYQRQAAGVLPPEELLAELREAHAARPDLWHAAVAVARQLLQLERPAEARALLDEAAHRFPLLPRVWVELAQVHHVRGDLAAEREVLGRALELQPAWREPALRLAELLHAAGELEAERAHLLRALRHAPADALLHGWLADALRGLDRPDEAIEELQRAVRLDPGYAWAAVTLQELCAARGRPGLPAELGEALVAERPLDPRAWLLAARLRPTPAGRLEAVDRALALSPRDAEAVARRVALLAADGRLDEAIAAVAAPPWIGPPPRALRLEAARLEARLGRTREARLALEALLEAEPDFLEGWEQAASWHDDAGRHEDCLAAARQVVRLAPHRSVSLGWLGLALLAAGDRAGGKEAIRRAVELDPAYEWGLRRLLDLRLEDGELDEAAALLAQAERHLDGGEVTLRRLQLAARRKDGAAAAAALGALAREDDAGRLDAAVAELEKAKLGREVEAALGPLLATTAGTRAAGAAWCRFAAKGQRRGAVDRRLLGAVKAAARGGAAGPALRGAVQAWLERLGDLKDRRRLGRWLRRHRALLEADDQLWGTAGYALCTARDHAAAAGWLGGWRTRAALEPWMLLNLSLSLAHRHQLAAAAAVSRAALALPADHTRDRHRSLVAAEAALHGELEPLTEVPHQDGRPVPFYACLHALVRALQVGLEAEDRAAGWREAQLHLAAAARAMPDLSKQPFLVHYRWRTAQALARRRGGPLQPWWLLAGLHRAGAFR